MAQPTILQRFLQHSTLHATLNGRSYRPRTSTRYRLETWRRSYAKLRPFFQALVLVLLFFCGSEWGRFGDSFGGSLGGSLGGGPVPLSAQSRADWVVAEISARNVSMSPSRRAEKYALMGDSVMSFFRATNYLYWADHAHSPLLLPFGGVPQTRIWLHGDCHVENIGALANSQGQVVYDLDDFDDAVIGDYQLDLWRLATSLVLLLRENSGFSASDEENLLNALSTSYLMTLGSYQGNPPEQTRIFTASNTPSPLSDFLSDTTRKSSRLRMLEKLTAKANGRRVFDFYHPDILPVPRPVEAAIIGAMPNYIATLPPHMRNHPGYFRVKSVAQRLRGGMGSLGMARYYVLIEGATANEEDDRVLDFKAQGVPNPWPYIDLEVRNQILAVANGNHALRTVLAARALGYHVDEHMGTATLFGSGFSVRERTPARGSLDVRDLSSPSRVIKLAEVWGAILATAHARADQDAKTALIPYKFETEVLRRIGDQQAQFRAHVRQVALSYANQVAADHAAFSRTLLHRQTASRD